MERIRQCDLAIVGGGLAKRRPEARAADRGPARLGGEHLWCFLESDIVFDNRPLVVPLAAHWWDGRDAFFPGHHRALVTRCHAITAERLCEALRRAFPAERILTSRRAIGVGPRSVVQEGGFRFVRLQPLAADRLRGKDHQDDDAPADDRDARLIRVAARAEARGWRISEVGQGQEGARPIVLNGDFEAHWRSGGSRAATVGERAALVHPAAGDALSEAVRVARLPNWSAPALHDALHSFARAAWRERRFYRRFNRMQFRTARPAERHRMLDRLYRLDESLIGRFYAGSLTARDKTRIVAGRPTVPIGRALRVAAGVRGGV